MNVFEAVKGNVTTRQAAEMYSIRVNRQGMAICPFHNDKNPSMKVDMRFHCFACQADGDAVDFVSRLFGLPSKEAAMKLADDFGICYDSRQKPTVRPKIRGPTPEQRYQQEENRCYKVLTDYFHSLQAWKQQYAPKQPEDEWHPLFVEALQRESYIEYNHMKRRRFMMKYCKPKLTDNGSLINVSVMSNALFNTKLVGILQININSDHALLTHFSVHPDYRRIGVGKSMMMKLVEYLQQQNFIHPILVYPNTKFLKYSYKISLGGLRAALFISKRKENLHCQANFKSIMKWLIRLLPIWFKAIKTGLPSCKPWQGSISTLTMSNL